TRESRPAQTIQVYRDRALRSTGSGRTLDTTVIMAGGTRRLTVQASDGTTIFKQTIYINVSGAQPALSTTPTTLTFASQNVGTSSAAKTVTATNETAGAVTFSSITTSGDFSQSNNCGSSLAAGASCTVSVTFTPTATGTRNGTLTVTDSDASSPQTVSLSGTGGSSSSCNVSTVNPSVTICTPAANATVTSPVHIVAKTTDSKPVNYIQIYVDGVKKYETSGGSLDTSLAM